MSQATQTLEQRRDEVRTQLAGVELPVEDGVPMDSDWHFIQIHLLIDLIQSHLGTREEYYVGGNMFIHYSVEQVRNRDFLGPDFFFVRGRPRLPLRDYWAVWEEEFRFPDLIVELVSPTTETNDRTKKLRIYEGTFRTPNYFIYDPLTETLDGYQLSDAGIYEPLSADDHGRMWCEVLGLYIGPWQGRFHLCDTVWLRFFSPDGNLVPTQEERAQLRAEAERQRAEAAEAELARLRRLLGGMNPPTTNGH